MTDPLPTWTSELQEELSTLARKKFHQTNELGRISFLDALRQHSRCDLNHVMPQEVYTAIAKIRRMDFQSWQYQAASKHIIMELESGETDPATAIRKGRLYFKFECQEEATNPETFHLVAPSSYLDRSKAHKPPRPVQNFMAVYAARHATLITLHGGSGLGKTTSALRGIVLRSIVSGRRYAIGTSGMRLSRMKPSERSEFVELAIDYKGTLLLDDIDKGGKAEGTSSALLEIIEARENSSDFLTIITTNATGPSLKAKLETGYGDPIVNRLSRGVCIDFDPVDVDRKEGLKAIQGIIKAG